MNPFDLTIISFLNRFAHISNGFDVFMYIIATNNLMKGGMMILPFWWFWFRDNPQIQHYRRTIIASLSASILSVIISRELTAILPFRPRPIHNPALGFIPPHGVDIPVLSSMSSFPSDHAVLFFGMATGIYYLSKRLGIISFIYAVIVISIPRIYLGMHYPTDILGGAVIGILGTWIVIQSNMHVVFIKNFISRIMAVEMINPALFYMIFFLVTSQIVFLFEPFRELVEFCMVVIRKLLFSSAS